MLVMYTRSLEPPKQSFFLFGPRGTGKTTWLKNSFKDAKWFDLLRTQQMLSLMRDPNSFRQQVEALSSGSWVVVDEIQRLPSLLNEVHSLIADHGKKYHFALTGSSARKLKRMDTNLLAGRAINRRFFPLTGKEMDFDFKLDDLLKFGCLPAIRSEPSEPARVDMLEAYAGNYIREEIQQEAAVKNLESFSRFLEVAALMNGQITNVAGISRDAAVARPTVQGYFQVLIDTLVGTWIPAWRPKAKIKETGHPKFYFFDPGVVRAVQGKLREPLESQERGWLLETLIVQELRAWMSIGNLSGDLSYWRTPSGTEVDFIWTRGKHSVGIEVKASSSWKSEFGRPLLELRDAGKIKRAFAIYTGNDVLKDGDLLVLPVKSFMKKLSDGEILG
jgi:predicted AAA+ superfamily ATPase